MKIKITVLASRRLCFEDTKRIMSPEIHPKSLIPDFRETGPWFSYCRILSLPLCAGLNRVIVIVSIFLSFGLVNFLGFVPFALCLIVFFQTEKFTICQNRLAGSVSPQMQSFRSEPDGLRELLISKLVIFSG